MTLPIITSFMIWQWFFITLFFLHRGHWRKKTEFARKQLQVLRKGYEYEHRLADSWYESLPLFLRLRDIGLYGTIQKKFKGKDMPEDFQKLSDELYERIIKQEAIVNI